MVQKVVPLPNKTGLNVTIAKYLTPNGTDINKLGIKPDVEIGNDFDFYLNNKIAGSVVNLNNSSFFTIPLYISSDTEEAVTNNCESAVDIEAAIIAEKEMNKRKDD